MLVGLVGHYTLHLRLPDGRPILFWVLVLVGACQSGTVWAGLCLIHHHHQSSTPPEVKCGFALARSGYAQYPAYRGRAFVWLGFRRMQSEFSGPGVLWAIQQNSYVKLA